MNNFYTHTSCSFLDSSSFFYQNNTFVGSFNTSLVSFMLLTLLSFALVLTFHSKGTTVHKVLGLLLVSIFVVFIWILQTQFLFIYIVYVLAFISAVLMLFLSVVLMLPISTLTSKNTFKNSTILLSSVTLYDDANNFLMMPTLLIFLALLFTLYLSNYYGNKKFVISKQDLSKWNSKYVFTALNTNLNNFKNLSTKNKLSNLLFLNLFYKAFWKIYSSVQQFSLTIIYVLMENLHKVFFNSYKLLIDAFTQTFLFLIVMAGFFAMFLNKRTLLYLNLSEMNLEMSQGIGQLKSLLYGEFSLFLLFSTVVLLVALLGAAVMTRSKR